MENEIVTLEYQVDCDFCKLRIRPGEKCIVSMDSATGKVYFRHLRCPSAPAVHTRRKPAPPKRHFEIMNQAYAH